MIPKAALVALGFAAALGAGAAAAWLLGRAEHAPSRPERIPPRIGPAAGSIAGVVRWTGPVPVRRSHPVTRDPAACGAFGPEEELLVGRNGELENALVSVEGIADGHRFPAPPYPIALDVAGRLFRERVTVVPAGSQLEVRNGDTILHNAHFNALRNRSENFAIPAGMAQLHSVRTPETIEVTCDIHRDRGVAAYVIVRDDPYFSLTEADGHFVIRDVPPGRRRVRVWHERLGSIAREVDVAAGAETTLYWEVAPR